MSIAITGAAGHLGSHLVAALQARGITDLIRIDMAPLADGPGLARQANLADFDATRAALEGADLIVHLASIHPWKDYPDSLYLDLNVKGTWNVYKAADELGIRRVVLTSSIAASGYSIPMAQWPVAEDVEGHIGDIYSYTKRCQEEAALAFAGKGIRTVALRPPAFMPKPELESAVGRLGCFTVVDDIVSAHLAAIDRIDAMPSDFEAFFVTNALPYSAADADLEGQFWPLAERHFPGVTAWFKARGDYGFWMPMTYSLEKAGRLLGWQPQHSFAQWWAAHGPSA